ncbi:hypothetical protein [Sinosporangium siamense]|uniref:Uncharacterized protein n=1 Tax=Sinosporangium siamense TaxID=1367973 RepID=A0A919RPE9_9ACTN|nr:hypothetical protein [Sinosporangium siamense]GII96852.1 hypothetical protein Ssi02_70830 [Sinosporangium siamense]
MALNRQVADAIEWIRLHVDPSPVTVREDGEGGAFVIVESIALGDALYHQTESWIGFRITFQYPYADVYPHYVRGDLTRRDASPLGEAMSVSSFEGRPAIQISRRSNRLNPVTDTAVIKLVKVIEWLRTRP